MLKPRYSDIGTPDETGFGNIREPGVAGSVFETDDEAMPAYRTADEEIFVEDRMWQEDEDGRVTLAQVRDDIELVRREIDHLKARLAVVAERAATVVRSRAEWADAAAHAQLGNYPWAKLSGAMAGAFLATRILRRLPLGALTTAVAPVVVAALQKKAPK